MPNGQLNQVLKEVIEEWDPMGLFPDCPSDEYSIEIEEILLIANGGIKSSEELGQIIFNVFKKYFDSCFIKSATECVSIAQKILTKIF